MGLKIHIGTHKTGPEKMLLNYESLIDIIAYSPNLSITFAAAFVILGKLYKFVFNFC